MVCDGASGTARRAVQTARAMKTNAAAPVHVRPGRSGLISGVNAARNLSCQDAFRKITSDGCGRSASAVRYSLKQSEQPNRCARRSSSGRRHDRASESSLVSGAAEPVRVGKVGGEIFTREFDRFVWFHLVRFAFRPAFAIAPRRIAGPIVHRFFLAHAHEGMSGAKPHTLSRNNFRDLDPHRLRAGRHGGRRIDRNQTPPSRIACFECLSFASVCVRLQARCGLPTGLPSTPARSQAMRTQV
jgi:hypothetical protein